MTSPITPEVEPNEYPLLADSYKAKKKKGTPRYRRWLWRIGGSIVVLLLIWFACLGIISWYTTTPMVRQRLPIAEATYDAQTLWANPLPIARPIRSVPTHDDGINPLCVELVNGTGIAGAYKDADPRLVAYVNRDLDLASLNIAVDGQRVVLPPAYPIFRSMFGMMYPVRESEIDDLPFEPQPRGNGDEIVGYVVSYTDNEVCFTSVSPILPGLHVATLRIESHDRSGLYTHQWAFLAEVGAEPLNDEG
jgi:hypothetical protein